MKTNCPRLAYIPKNPIKEKLRYVTTSRPVLKWYCYFPNYSHVTWVIHAPTMTCENTQYHLLVPADRLFGSRISWESFFVILELTPKRFGSKRSKFLTGNKLYRSQVQSMYRRIYIRIYRYDLIQRDILWIILTIHMF